MRYRLTKDLPFAKAGTEVEKEAYKHNPNATHGPLVELLSNYRKAVAG